jgi:uncharacterized Tic20 family protein
MTNLEAVTPTQDDRVMAALSHVSVLLPMMGVITPTVIWVTQKEKSPYVAYQALQALVFQLSMIAVWFISMGCYICSFLTMFIILPFAASVEPSQSISPFFGLPIFTPFLVLGVIFVVFLLYIIYGLIGAAMTLQGRNFRYLFIGLRIERFMQEKQV